MINRYEISGFITGVDFHSAMGHPWDIGVGPGHHFRGFFTYDTSVSPDANGEYRGPYFEIDVLIYKGDGSVLDRTHGSDTFAVLNPGVAPAITIPPFPPPTFGIQTQGSTSTYWGIWLGDNTGTLVATSNLPDRLPELSRWDKKIFWFAIDGSGFLTGELDSLILMANPAAPAPPSNLVIKS